VVLSRVAEWPGEMKEMTGDGKAKYR
jgi:hypothetical protein